MASKDDSHKWDFIEDPDKAKYREVADNCASTITSQAPNWTEEGYNFQAFFASQIEAYKLLFDSSKNPESGELRPCGTFFESHPVMDGHRCAECFDTKVYTRCYFNPSDHRSFYFCRNCSESFEKKGYRLLE